jgi:hypothetical protein
MAQMKAVLVGVEEYARSDIPPLRGCVNDVLLVRSILKGHFGLDNEDIHVVLNSRATRAGILARLERMVDGAAPGDLLVFYFSGHGSQIRDRDGDELTDFLDELICPYDLDWDRRRYILDDDLDRVFGALPDGVVLEAFFDCCFWGASPRTFDEYDQTAVLRPDVRYLPPPLDIAARYEGDEDQIGVHRLENCQCFGDTNVLWGASAEGHSAAEDIFDGRVHGVFTYYGCSFIASRFEQIVAREYSREQLLDDLRAYLRTRGYVQVPELAAPPDLRMLGPFYRRAWRERMERVP